MECWCKVMLRNALVTKMQVVELEVLTQQMKYWPSIKVDNRLHFYILVNYLPLDMLFSGIVQCAQKLATQYGDCEALVPFWKASMGTYHETGKVEYIALFHIAA